MTSVEAINTEEIKDGQPVEGYEKKNRQIINRKFIQKSRPYKDYLWEQLYQIIDDAMFSETGSVIKGRLAVVEQELRDNIDRLPLSEEMDMANIQLNSIILAGPASLACLTSYTSHPTKINRDALNTIIMNLKYYYPDEYVVWRGFSANEKRTPENLLKLIELDKEYSAANIMSTSLDAVIATTFLGQEGGILMALIVPPNYPALFLGTLPGTIYPLESEVILAKGTRYRVESKNVLYFHNPMKFEGKLESVPYATVRVLLPPPILTISVPADQCLKKEDEKH